MSTYAGAIASTGVMLVSTAQRLMSPSATIEEAAELPADWDEFWQASAPAYDFILARDRRAMEWRYFRHPFSYRILVARSGGAIQGYVVYRIVHGDDLSVLSIADFLFRPGQWALLRTLLGRVVARAVRAGVAAISAWCPAGNPHFAVFRQFGFFARGNVPVIAFQNEAAKRISENTRRWHFTMSDSDNV